VSYRQDHFGLSEPIDLSRLASDIEHALPRVHRYAAATPLFHLARLDSMIAGRVFLKAECLQATGSFKIRGALNVMSQLREQQHVDRVVAFSSGNHGIGVAYAGRCLGMHATVVIPLDAPATKVARIKALGADIVFYDRLKQDREEVAMDLQQSLSGVLVKPYDDWATIAGQGTCALEAFEQTGHGFDSVIVCTGGGGLAAGMGTSLRARDERTQVFTAEPRGWDDHRLSLSLGRRTPAPATGSDWCDGLLAPTPGELTFGINRANGASGLSVEDEEVFRAMQLMYLTLGIRLEPSGAVALASLISYPEKFRAQRVLVTLTGGNVDDQKFTDAMRLAG
jgi:threonine dehydratase